MTIPAELSRSGELCLWMKRMSPSSAVMCLGWLSEMVKKGNTQVFSSYTSRFCLSVAENGQMFGTGTGSYEDLWLGDYPSVPLQGKLMHHPELLGKAVGCSLFCL